MTSDLVSAAVNAAYEAVRYRMPWLTLDQFREQAKAWEINPVQVAGQVVGAVIVKGNEIHACILPWACGRWFMRPHLEILNAVIRKHGKAVSVATTPAGEKFIKRLGFVQAGDKYERTQQYGT